MDAWATGPLSEVYNRTLCDAGGITLVKFALPFDLVEPKLDFAELCEVGGVLC